MKTITTPQLKAGLLCACDKIVSSEARLTEIDTIIGDGDHGFGMREGFTALKALLSGADFDSPYELYRASGMHLVRVMGGASGVIFGTLFIGGHEVLRDKTALSAADWVAFHHRSAAAIMKRGRSARGDKTMLDALFGALDAMDEALKGTDEVAPILRAGAAGALAGAEATRHMLPQTGRSKNFREQALGVPDPGAVSVSILFEGICEGITAGQSGPAEGNTATPYKDEKTRKEMQDT